MAKSQNDLVAAAQTLARLQAKRERIAKQVMVKLAAIDTDIATVRAFIENAVQDAKRAQEPWAQAL